MADNNDNQIEVTNPQLLSQIFQPPQLQDIKSNYQLPKIQQTQVLMKNQTRAAVMKREYDQKLEQTRQQTQRAIIQQEIYELNRFKETKEKLIEGNETIIRDVDEILDTQDQEKQLTKEKMFVDYEMNTFIPIHTKIQQNVEASYKEKLKYKQTLHQAFADYTKKKHVSLENVNEEEYNPYINDQKIKIKINDPVERANKIRDEENQIIKDIEKLTGKKEIQFQGHQTNLQNLREGDLKEKQIRKQRDMVDVEKWEDVSRYMVLESKKVRERDKTQVPPFATHEQ